MKERGGRCREENIRLVTKLQYKQCMEPISHTKCPASKSPGTTKDLAPMKGPAMEDPGYRNKVRKRKASYKTSGRNIYFPNVLNLLYFPCRTFCGCNFLVHTLGHLQKFPASKGPASKYLLEVERTRPARGFVKTILAILHLTWQNGSRHLKYVTSWPWLNPFCTFVNLNLKK
jgi:hypothetical protein